jgi:hypothetical protein
MFEVTACVLEIFLDSRRLALEHVLEVHVAADVQLVGAVQDDAAVLEQLGHDAVGDGRADLALDVVADDRDARGAELLGPLRRAGDEDGQRVDEGDLRVDGALRVELRRRLRADGQVADQDVGARVLRACTTSTAVSSDSSIVSR